MIRHQQIPEGHAFVEPRSPETARALLDAAKELDLDASVVQTQQGGYLAPSEVVEKFQRGDGVSVTEASDSEPAEESEARPAVSASKGEWVAFAKTQDYDESEGLTKDELIERYGASE